MVEEFKKIGFTENQAKVYLALIKLGECTIGPIEQEVGLFKQSIYNTLKDLISRNFVKVIKKNNRQYFLADDPDIILTELQSKERTIERLIPELYALTGVHKYISDIKVYGGVKAFQSFHEKILKQISPHSELKIIGAGGDEFLKITQQEYFFTRYENLRLNKKVSHKLLMYENQRNTNKEYLNRRYVEVKFLPQIFHQPIATQIWPDRIAILLFGNDPQIIEIKSKKITDGFNNYFDMLWQIGKI